MGAEILMAAMLAATATLGPASELRFAGRNVLLGDVARVKGPGAARLRQIVVARLTAASARHVSRPALAGLIRRAVPGLRVTGKGPENVTLISLAPRADSLQGPCFEARNAIAGGAAIHAEDAVPVATRSTRRPTPTPPRAY